MNKKIYLIILLLTCRICSAQNLIPNGDFEQYSGCPNNPNQIDSSLNWIGTAAYSIENASYFNQCDINNGVGVPNNFFGYQQAHSGVAYAGLALWFKFVEDTRQYIEVTLTSSLIANACYHFQMYVNLANNSSYTTDAIQAYFSDTIVSEIQNSYPLPFSPQISNTTGNTFDTLNWALVSGNYTAVGGENYLIIGNFMFDLTTDTFAINANGISSIFCFIDDVTLTPCTGINEQNENGGIFIYPNPFSNKLQITTNSKELSEIILYDVLSRKLLQQKFTNSISLSAEQLAKGIYIYEVRNKDGLIKKGKVVKE
jgi:hypothetical protein